MSGWRYKVPTLAEWEANHHGQRPSAIYSADGFGVWPRIGIYCEHAHDPRLWLVGTFTLDGDILRERGSVYWAWRREYVTGDGHVIHLGQRSGDRGAQSIVDDAPYSRDAMVALLREDPLGSMPMWEHAQAAMRSRVRLRCGGCSLDHILRAERVHEPLSALWRAGVREVGLAGFVRASNIVASRDRS